MDFKPPLPTDNLYKFAALFGLALIILWFIAYYDYIQVSTKDKQTSNKVMKLLGEQSETLNNLLRQSATMRGSSNSQIKEWSEQNRIIISQNFELLEQYKLEEEKIKNELILKTNLLENILKYFLHTGIVLSVIGFWLWYWKLQRHQDRIIKIQATTGGRCRADN